MDTIHKVLVVNSTGGFFGGAERYVFDSSSLLRRHGWKLWGLFEKHSNSGWDEFQKPFEETWLTAGRPLPEIIGLAKAAGIGTAFIHKTMNRGLVAALLGNFKCVCFVHDHDYYCPRRHKYFPLGRLNCHLPFNLGYCSVCSCLLEKRPGGIGLINPFARAALLRTYKRADRFVVLSDFMRDNLLMNGIACDRIVKLRPVVAVTATSPADGADGPARILYVGQLIRGKGVDLLLRALPLMRGEFRLSVVGKGNDGAFLARLASRLGLDGKVEFKGYCEDLEAEYARCDMVAVPSRWQEPFGLVGVEAFAHAKPVVGFDVGGIGEWLKDGQNGRLVRERDLPAFAAALDSLAADRDLARRLGANGLDFVRRQCREEDFVEGLGRLTGNF